MSKHILLKSAFTSVLGVLLGYSLTYFYSQNLTGDSSRKIASNHLSTAIHKLGTDQISRTYFQVKLSTPQLAQTQSDGHSTVVATITALQDVPEKLQYAWQLGKDVESTQALEGFLPALKAGESKEIDITVSNFYHEVQNHVSLQIKGNIGEHSVSRHSIISSRPEDSFDYVVQQAAQQRELEPNNIKIQKLSNGQKINGKFSLDKIIR